ncbi:YjdF family protein [Clostridium oceanicum]|uniref:DUF2992 domain-containing protein n=1 Tax=Clostridium oceanicum TaxID=1543 RepID=A0ABP3UH82_9CLOT
MEVSSKITVLFEDPFWVGIFERSCNHKYEVSKVVFGSEPKDYEIYEFILNKFNSIKFSTPVSISYKKDKKINPKRLQRKIKKEVNNKGVGTKAQLAMKTQQESNKIIYKKISKEKKEEYKKRKFLLKQKKKREKHKGH